MGAFFQDHTSLLVACVLTLIALLVLAAVELPMHVAKASLRSVVFVGVFFAIICVTQVLAHGASALWHAGFLYRARPGHGAPRGPFRALNPRVPRKRS